MKPLGKTGKKLLILGPAAALLWAGILGINISAPGLQEFLNPAVTLTWKSPLPQDLAQKQGVDPFHPVSEVYLAGYFNSWQARNPEFKFAKTPLGTWELVHLFSPGENVYKLVVVLEGDGGTIWIPDTLRGELVSDNNGGFNTKLFIPDIDVWLFLFNVFAVSAAALMTGYVLLIPLLNWVLRLKISLRFKLVAGLVAIAAITNLVMITFHTREEKDLLTLGLNDQLNLIYNFLDSGGVEWGRLESLDQKALVKKLVRGFHSTAQARTEKNIFSNSQLVITELLVISADGKKVLERSSRLPVQQAQLRAVEEGFRTLESYYLQGAFAPLLKEESGIQTWKSKLRVGLSPVNPLGDGPVPDLAGLGFNTFLYPVIKEGRVQAYLAGELDTRLYGGELNRIRWYGLYILFLSLIGAALVLTAMGRVLTSHIRELIHWTDMILSGNYRGTMDLATGDEIQVLARNFDRMRQGLKDSFQTIDAQHHRLVTEAYQDKMTGLPNRQRLFAVLETPAPRSLVLFNIDGFQKLNDFFGHEMGDQILVEIGRRLVSMSDSRGDVYKISSDEFAVLFNQDLPESALTAHALSLLSGLMNTCYAVDGQEVYISFSSGGSSANDEKTEGYRPSKILGEADMAMKKAKRSSNRFLFYRPEFGLRKEYGRQIVGTRLLREALKDGRILPYYQPIVDNATGEITKWECLVRLKDEEGQVLAPHQFLDIAKKARFYPFITKVMLFKSMMAMKNVEWEFSLNLCLEDLLDGETRSCIESAMAASPEIAKRMVFEIVESEEITDYGVMRDYLAHLRSLGAKIAIDDFGTGYSNFAYLIQLQVDYLKIDAGLIRDLDTDPNAQSVTRAIVRFAHELGIKTVAEYVHNEAVYRKVLEYGIDYSQGYYFGKPQEKV